MKKNELIAYAESFVSFVFPRLKTPVSEIILFGSIPRGDFDRESDVDIFFDVQNSKNENQVKSELKAIQKKYYKSQIYNIWKQKGLTNIISTKVGILDTWELKRSIISGGIVLYGKYKSNIKGKGHILFSLDPVKNVTKRNKVIRTLFGRKEATYNKPGKVEELGGRKLAPTVFLTPMQFSDEIIQFLKKEKVSFKLFEVWTDQL